MAGITWIILAYIITLTSSHMLHLFLICHPVICTADQPGTVMTDEASWTDTEKILKRMVKFRNDCDMWGYKK